MHEQRDLNASSQLVASKFKLLFKVHSFVVRDKYQCTQSPEPRPPHTLHDHPASMASVVAKSITASK